MTDYNETGELVPYSSTGATPARVDMRDRVTDSWTSVVQDVAFLAERIADTEFVPSGLRGSVPKVAAAILHGRELGLPPMTALSSVHVIKGKAGISAEVMRSLILQAGHEFRVHESTQARCVMQARRRGESEWQTFSYTMADAERAGDTRTNPNYKSRPAEMLLARCTTRMARTIFADVIHGMRSTEELEDMSEPGGEPVEPAPPAVGPVRRQTRREQPRAVEAKEPEEPATPAPTEAPAAEQQPARTVRRKTRTEAPRGRTQTTDRPGAGEDPTPVDPKSTPGEGGMPPDGQGTDTGEPSPGDATPTTGGITTEQRTHIQMHMKRLGIEDRDERLYWTGVAAGRGDQPVGSTNELTADEARDTIDRLQRLKDRAALEAMGAALAKDDPS